MTPAEAAAGYAARGWPVLPLWPPAGSACACPAGAACPSPGKHPRTAHGVHDATAELDRVERWWAGHPDDNVGLATGAAFDVLDLDGQAAGDELARLAHRAGADTETCWAWGPMAATGRGSHLFYVPSGHGNRARLAGVDGVDWRGRSGYVVAPPSLHVSGRRYAWHPDCGPDTPLPAVPAVLAELLAGTRPAAEAPSAHRDDTRATRHGWSPAGLVGRVAAAAAGERNTVLHWAACRIAGDVRIGKAPEHAALAALDQLALAAERAGLDRREVDATIRSGWAAR